MSVTRFAALPESGSVAKKRIFICADLNVPQGNSGAITEDTRVCGSMLSIQMALEARAVVMVTSHLHRLTKGESKPVDSLVPVANRSGELRGRNVPLVSDGVNGERVKGQPVYPGQMVPLENRRVNVDERKHRSAGLQTRGAFSIAGGGDTLAATGKYGPEKVVGNISTVSGIFLKVPWATHCRRLRSCISVQRTGS